MNSLKNHNGSDNVTRTHSADSEAWRKYNSRPGALFHPMNSESYCTQHTQLSMPTVA